MNQFDNGQPADWAGFFIFIGLIIAVFALVLIGANYGWLVFAWVLGSMLSLAWLAAVIWLLWSINRKLGPLLTDPEKKTGELPKISALSLSDESKPSVVAEGTTRPSIYDLKRDDKGRIIAD